MHYWFPPCEFYDYPMARTRENCICVLTADVSTVIFGSNFQFAEICCSSPKPAASCNSRTDCHQAGIRRFSFLFVVSSIGASSSQTYADEGSDSVQSDVFAIFGTWTGLKDAGLDDISDLTCDRCFLDSRPVAYTSSASLGVLQYWLPQPRRL